MGTRRTTDPEERTAATVAPVAVATVAEVDARVALIQTLIPVGLEAFHAELQRELVSVVGERYARMGRQPGLVRWTPRAWSTWRTRSCRSPCRACATADTIAKCPWPHIRSSKCRGSWTRGCCSECWGDSRRGSMPGARRRCPRPSGSVPPPSRVGSSARVRARCRRCWSAGSIARRSWRS